MTQPVQPLADYGYFGPGTVTWKVWGHTTTPVTGAPSWWKNSTRR